MLSEIGVIAMPTSAFVRGYSCANCAAMVFISAIGLAVTGRYPRGLYDFILGMNRWVLRVAAYTSLMTDAYPPFRLDTGGTDPATAVIAPTA